MLAGPSTLGGHFKQPKHQEKAHTKCGKRGTKQTKTKIFVCSVRAETGGREPRVTSAGGRHTGHANFSAANDRETLPL